eukprot:GFUD01026069.1.p1 GENE.GFUD01026069.1~~GFUD01026069.1.p1  ORF type:complete len:129 (+),score=51.51 GFUD01026069.1:178-564(+)
MEDQIARKMEDLKEEKISVVDEKKESNLVAVCKDTKRIDEGSSLEYGEHLPSSPSSGGEAFYSSSDFLPGKLGFVLRLKKISREEKLKLLRETEDIYAQVMGEINQEFGLVLKNKKEENVEQAQKMKD